MDKNIVRKVKLAEGNIYYFTSDILVPVGSEHVITLPELQKDEVVATESFVEWKINECIIMLLSKEY